MADLAGTNGNRVRSSSRAVDGIERYRETKFLHRQIGEPSAELSALKWGTKTLAGPVN